jgi:Mg-chelatase subunit ChlD
MKDPLPPYEDIEVQLTALLLGEVGEEEARRLHAKINSDPALQALHQELKASTELMLEAAQVGLCATSADEQAPVQMSEDRRQALFESFHKEESVNVHSGGKAVRGIPWFVPMGIAAALIALMCVTSMFLNTKSVMGSIRNELASIEKLRESNVERGFPQTTELFSNAPVSFTSGQDTTVPADDFYVLAPQAPESDVTAKPPMIRRQETLSRLEELPATRLARRQVSGGTMQAQTEYAVASPDSTSESSRVLESLVDFDSDRGNASDALESESLTRAYKNELPGIRAENEVQMQLNFSKGISPADSKDPLGILSKSSELNNRPQMAAETGTLSLGRPASSPAEGLASGNKLANESGEERYYFKAGFAGKPNEEPTVRYRDQKRTAESLESGFGDHPTWGIREELSPQESVANRVDDSSNDTGSLDLFGVPASEDTPFDDVRGGYGINVDQDFSVRDKGFVQGVGGLPAGTSDVPAGNTFASGEGSVWALADDGLGVSGGLGGGGGVAGNAARGGSLVEGYELESRAKVDSLGGMQKHFGRASGNAFFQSETMPGVTEPDQVARFDDRATVVDFSVASSNAQFAEWEEQVIAEKEIDLSSDGLELAENRKSVSSPVDTAESVASLKLSQQIAPAPERGRGSRQLGEQQQNILQRRLELGDTFQGQVQTLNRGLTAVADKNSAVDFTPQVASSNGLDAGLDFDADAPLDRSVKELSRFYDATRSLSSLGEQILPGPPQGEIQAPSLGIGESKRLGEIALKQAKPDEAVKQWFESPLSPAVVEPSGSRSDDTALSLLGKKRSISKPLAGANVEHRPEQDAGDEAISTFSLNVSDVSFKLAQAALDQGQLPHPESIRSEQFLNAFDFRDPAPYSGQAIGFNWEVARHPFAHHRNVLRLALKTAATGRETGRPMSLTLLLDNSGSMERSDRREILRQALDVLSQTLSEQDKISVVSFARTARLWVDGVPGGSPGSVLEPVQKLVPQGGTNLEEALNVAYEVAQNHYLKDGVNRVILLTDGAANLGNVDPETLKQKVESERRRGVAFDCFGIGWDGLNDPMLESLSRNGDGRYAFLNDPAVAGHEFAGRLAGALNVAASDVKVQVEFNPGRVGNWRQIGYAKHQLTKEQFRDNTVDAAEIAASEAGNALYVIEPKESGTGPIGVVRVRFREPHTNQYHEKEWTVPYRSSIPETDESSPSMKLAMTSSLFAEWLNGNPHAGSISIGDLKRLLNGVPEIYGNDPRPQTLDRMLEQARQISGL